MRSPPEGDEKPQVGTYPLLFMMLLFILMYFLTSVASNDTPFFIHIHKEGIGSILRSIAFVYDNLERNRTIILSKYNCFHYRGLGEMDICDYIQFPSRIKCDREHSIRDFLAEKDCIWVNRNKSYDVNSLSCLSRAPVDSFHLLPWNYTQRVWDLFAWLPKVIPLDDHLAAFHWRRGDQLRTRCVSGEDTSVNCSPVDDFIDKVNATTVMIRTDLHIEKPLHVYIATNEEDPSVLQQLTESGFYHSGQIVGLFQLINKTVDPLELYLLDTMVLCFSNYLYMQGRTTVQALIEDCRERKMLGETHGIVSIDAQY